MAAAAGPQPLAPTLRLERLALTRFRNYAALTWHPAPHLNLLSGPNGSGKTNLLEAVSLLVPGRGLRGARLADLAQHHAEGAWAVAARLATPDGPLEVGTGTPPEGPAERRAFRLDGAVPRSQAEIGTRLAAVWLTPEMDRLLQEGASARLRFLDRLVFATAPGHAREVSAHAAAVLRRNRLLAGTRHDPAWLAGLEDSIARHAVAVTAARLALVARLHAALASGLADPFPRAHLGLAGPLAEALRERPALAVEQALRDALAAARAADAAAGRASLGAHRADLVLDDAASGLTAATASTGQQKALLLGVVLGHAALLAQAQGGGPLLLLDEPAVHLDATRRAALFATLESLPLQAFLTGTDAATFAPLHGRAGQWEVAAATVRADADSGAGEAGGTVNS